MSWSRSVLPFVAALLLCSDLRAGHGPIEFTSIVDPLTGTAPLEVTIGSSVLHPGGQNAGHYYARVYTSDGVEYRRSIDPFDSHDGWGFGIQHVFQCGGTHEIDIEWLNGGVVLYQKRFTIETPAEAVARYTIVADHATRPTRVRLEYFGLENRELITRSTIDWGDGSEIMDVTIQMFATGHLYGQPAHYPTTPGEFTVTSINYYGDAPCDPVPVTATWTSPIVVLPVEATTWGRVKALYR